MLGTAMQAPTASQVRRSVPRLTVYATHSGATTRWFEQRWLLARRACRSSRRAVLAALNAPGREPFRRASSPSRVLRNRAARGEHGAVAARALGRVERRVGAGEQLGGVLGAV